MLRAVVLLSALATLSSCAGFLPRPDKDVFAEGGYRYRVASQPQGRVYVLPLADTLRLRHLPQGPDSLLALPAHTVHTQPRRTFYDQSLDLDLFTAPVRYRPAAGPHPHQLRGTFNVNGYVGLRADRFVLRYRPTPLGLYRRVDRHLGLSVGGFVGLGAEGVKPDYVGRPITAEYDAPVLSRGVAVLVAVQQGTIGLMAGQDVLLDANSPHWYYHNRLWLGLGLGINLN